VGPCLVQAGDRLGTFLRVPGDGHLPGDLVGGITRCEITGQEGMNPGPARSPPFDLWSNVDHVWIELDGRDWGTATSNFAHGPGLGPQVIEGFMPSHPPGL
jgi:hypothetical protein